jgi:hypothetical protein
LERSDVDDEKEDGNHKARNDGLFVTNREAQCTSCHRRQVVEKSGASSEYRF